MVQSSEEHAKTRNRRERQALGISISSSVLAAHGAEVKSSQSEFTITDLLTQSSNSKQKQFKKQNHERGMLSSVSVPSLSPIRAAIEGPETTSNTKEVSTSSMIANDTPNSKIKPPEGFLSKLQPPENVELFAYSSALCHRLTGRYLPTKLIQQNPGAQQEEIARIQRHPKLVKAIDTIQVLSTQFKEVARETVGHRKELGHTLFRIEESYLKLFESLLEISLGMYWNYEQTSNAERAADKATIAHWQEMYGWKVAECKKLTQRLEAKEIFCRTQKVEIDDIKKQLEDLEDQVKDHRSLESRVLNLMDIETELRAKEREIQAELRELQQRYTEMIEYSRVQLEETRAQQKRIVEELKKSLREKEKTILKQDAAIRELSEKPEPVEYCTRTSQTEVDDDGLWDVQDGIPRFVSKTVLHRMMWRRFNAFVTCKNCGGRPLPRVGRGSCMNGQSAQKELDSSEIDSLAHQFVDIWSVSRAEKVSKKRTRRFESIEQQWELPAPVLLFLSNLPKSVMAFPFYSVEQVITQIEQIYDDKFISDQVDEADGVAQEELPKFICEYFLKLNELRQSAEIALYRFLVSAKCTYLRNTHIHLFARFANLLRNERSSSNSDQEPEPPKQNQPTQSGSGNQNVGTHYLDRSFLRVFLAARHYLLRKPPASASPKRSKKTKSDLSASKKPQIRELPHVIQVDGLKKWVPLDHAIAIVKWYLSYLPDDEVVAYCRQVEYSTALYIGGAITEVSGNRLAVRAEMRRAMLINGAEASSVDSNRHTDAGESNRSHVNPIIVADVHKVLLLLITALEQRQALMAKDLVDLFDKGDINHDRVLSLTEFTSIIRTRVPHFSDRRVLRMFREALMGGEDQSFALSMGAFVQVCSDHGLVSLLPDDRMRDPFQRSVPSVVASGATGKTLASALDALTDPKRARLLVSLTETRESNLAVTKESLADPQDIPEELPVSACIDFGVESSTSARAEEVSDDEGVDWEW